MTNEPIIQYGDDMDYLGRQVADGIAGIVTANRGHGEQRLVRDMQRLAITIPADQIRNAGQPVFPVLRQRIEVMTDVGAFSQQRKETLLNLLEQREQFGIAKYGQTLMSDDGRDTVTEVVNELLDTLPYMEKWYMQTYARQVEYLILRAADLLLDVVRLSEEMRDNGDITMET